MPVKPISKIIVSELHKGTDINYSTTLFNPEYTEFVTAIL